MVKSQMNSRSFVRVYYRIAGHVVELLLPRGVDSAQLLPTFEPFALDESTGKAMFSLTLYDQLPGDRPASARLLSDQSLTWEDRFRFYETSDSYLAEILEEIDGEVFAMHIAKDFSCGNVYVNLKHPNAGDFFNWFVMVAFAQRGLAYQTVLLHASAVEKEGKGYAFMGKSGTGKSTHSSLWLKYLDGYTLLNDDNPAVRIKADGSPAIYGTPWSGKTPCYRNLEVELKALVRLRQAPFNRYTAKRDKEALVAVLPGCSAIRWSNPIFASLIDVLELLIQKVSIGELDCLPDEEAATLCNTNIITTKNN